MRFTKMHGIGNDYVYVNCFDVPFPKDPAAPAAGSSIWSGRARTLNPKRSSWR